MYPAIQHTTQNLRKFTSSLIVREIGFRLNNMEIFLNGQLRPVPTDITLAELVEILGLVGRRLAVEVNLDVIPRSAYSNHRLSPGDRVEIVHAIGGG